MVITRGSHEASLRFKREVKLNHCCVNEKDVVEGKIRSGAKEEKYSHSYNFRCILDLIGASSKFTLSGKLYILLHIGKYGGRSMVAGAVNNPYDFINPIRSPDRFAGREKELKEIRYYLELSTSESPRYFHMALVGPRSVGKTSLLNMIEYIADNELGLLAFKLSLNEEIVKNDVLFFKEIFDGILTKGAERGMYGGLSGKIYRAFRQAIDTLKIEAEIPLLFGTAYIGFKKENITDVAQHILIHDLKKIHSEAKDKGIPTIVLLFDECDLLAQNRALLQKLRNVFMEVEGYILVISGTEKMFPAISEIFSPIPRFFKRINVGNFEEIKETEECLLKPLNDEEKKAFDKSCILDIHQLSNGSPYEINLIAHYMYRRWREGKNPKIQLSPEVLDDVLNELERLREAGHYEIANKIRNYWRDDLKILISLLEFPKVPEDWLVEYMLLDEIETIQLRDVHVRKSIIKDCVKHLKKDGMIAEEDGKILFKGDQFDVLYLKYLCASKGIRDTKEFFTGIHDDPLLNLHHKFLEGVLLKDLEYYIHTIFDKREKFEGKTGQKFIVGIRGNFPSGEHTILLFSPETQKEFYLGAPNSIRFRVNIRWMREGFVTQIKFKNKDNLEKFKRRLESLKEKLGFLGYEILLKDEISWNLEGIEYSKQGNMEKAMECFDKAIEINPLFKLPWANKADIFLRLKKYDEALNCVNKALEQHPNWTEGLKLKAMILINMGRNEEALEFLERTLKINPEDWSVWDNLGRAYFNLKKYENALKCFDRALELNPKNHELLYLKGVSLASIGKEKEAINCLDKALELNPDSISALLVKGKILLNRSHYEEALNCCDKVLEKEKTNISALGLKAIVLSKLNRYEDAIKCCDKILEIDQNNALAWYNKACFKARLGDLEDALKCLEKAVKIDEKYIEIAKNEEDFSNLNNNEKFIRLINRDHK